MSNVSDFKIAESVIKKVCQMKKTPFKDISISFQEPEGKIVSGSLRIGESQSLGQTSYKIVQCYFNNDQRILGTSLFDEATKSEFLVYAATTIKRLTTGGSECFEHAVPDEPFMQNLYARPLIWSLMKNIVCPIYQIPVRNIRVVGGNSETLDVARFFEEGECSDSNAPKSDFIFVNDGVNNEVCKNAFLFIEALKAHQLSPSEVMTYLMSTSMYKNLIGAAQLNFINDEDVEEFIIIIMDLLDLPLETYTHVVEASGEKNIKTAQAWDMPNRNGVQWWYFGLPEKMLTPARGADWTTHMNLEPWIQDFWGQVEKIKDKKPQGEGVNFNDLLRLKHMQSSEIHDISKSLQALLSEQRIW